MTIAVVAGTGGIRYKLMTSALTSRLVKSATLARKLGTAIALAGGLLFGQLISNGQLDPWTGFALAAMKYFEAQLELQTTVSIAAGNAKIAAKISGLRTALGLATFGTIFVLTESIPGSLLSVAIAWAIYEVLITSGTRSTRTRAMQLRIRAATALLVGSIGGSAASISLSVFQNLQRIELPVVLDINVAGYIVAILTFTQAFALVSNAATEPVVARLAAQFRSGGWSAARFTFYAALIQAALLGLAFAFPLVFLAKHVLKFAFGEDYQSWATTLTALSLASPVRACATVTNGALIAMGRESVAWKINTGLIISISTITYFLTINWGPVGFVIAYWTAYVAQFLATTYWLRAGLNQRH